MHLAVGEDIKVGHQIVPSLNIFGFRMCFTGYLGGDWHRVPYDLVFNFLAAPALPTHPPCFSSRSRS